MNAQDLIHRLQLKPLPEEGGFYRETFRDPVSIPEGSVSHLSGARAASTCIYYLITPEEFSGLHKVKSTEIFHFYAGDPVQMIQIDSNGNLEEMVLGNNLEENQTPQVVVPPDTWQGTKLLSGGEWALLGCTVAPGFEFSDFTGGQRANLLNEFPQRQKWIQAFTRA